MEKVTAPWWISIWPLLNVVLLIVVLIVAIFFAIKFYKFMQLGTKVFNDYLDKNKK